MGILPDYVLREMGSQLVEPFSQDMVQPSSIDLHIDRFFIRTAPFCGPLISPDSPNSGVFRETEEVVPGEVFILAPGEFVLASTFERVHIPTRLVARFEGKSSIGRLGLLTHITAGFIDPGFSGHITLELSNVTNSYWKIIPGMKIGQICFEELTAPARHPYGDPIFGSHYQGQRGPTPSRSHLNFSIVDVYGDSNADVSAIS